MRRRFPRGGARVPQERRRLSAPREGPLYWLCALCTGYALARGPSIEPADLDLQPAELEPASSLRAARERTEREALWTCSAGTAATSARRRARSRSAAPPCTACSTSTASMPARSDESRDRCRANEVIRSGSPRVLPHPRAEGHLPSAAHRRRASRLDPEATSGGRRADCREGPRVEQRRRRDAVEWWLARTPILWRFNRWRALLRLPRHVACWQTTRRAARRALRQYRPVIAMSEYAHFAACLRGAGSALRVVDSVEVFQRYRDTRQRLGFGVPISAHQEVRALNRAHVVVALQPNDAAPRCGSCAAHPGGDRRDRLQAGRPPRGGVHPVRGFQQLQ